MNNVKNFVKSLIFFTIFFIGIVSAASVWTNKNSYNFGETVIIYGGGFLPTQDISIEVDNPNDVFLFSNQTSPDNNGNFTSFYIISDQDSVNMIEGTYKIYANSQWTSSQNTFSVSSGSITTTTTSTTSTTTTTPTTTPPSNGGGGNPLKTTTTTTSTTTTTTLPPGLTLLILNESNNGNLADTFVDQGSNKTNYGKWNFTQVSSGSGMPFSNYRTFMLWDTKAIPPGSSIINAKISLYQNMPSAYNKMTLDLYNTSSMNSTGWIWSEYNLTWSNMPSLGTLQSFMNSTNTIGWKSWNVTDAFIAAYSNGNNFSLEIKNRTESTTNDVVSFVTKENATHSNLRPQLEIYYYLPITTTTTTSTTIPLCKSSGDACGSDSNCCSNHCCENICSDSQCVKQTGSMKNVIIIGILLGGIISGYYVYVKVIQTKLNKPKPAAPSEEKISSVSIENIKRELAYLKGIVQNLKKRGYDIPECEIELASAEYDLKRNSIDSAITHLNNVKIALREILR